MFKDKHMKVGFSSFFFPEMLIKNLVTNHQNLGIKRRWLECLKYTRSNGAVCRQ